MNPLILASIASGAKKVLTNRYVAIPILVIATVLLVRGGYRKWRKSNREKKFNRNETADPNQLAIHYRTASNPSGSGWLIDYDGTDDDAVERLAYQTKGVFDEVAKAYGLKYGETLSDRMASELDADELQSWRNIVT